MDEAGGGPVELMDLIAQVQQLIQVVSFIQGQQQAIATVATPLPHCPVNPLEKFDEKVDEFPAFLAQSGYNTNARPNTMAPPLSLLLTPWLGPA
ncbi:UNVERIFIED_CONTAM: hypothetical protein K2H54_056967 [Gekko kuhli]